MTTLDGAASIRSSTGPVGPRFQTRLLGARSVGLVAAAATAAAAAALRHGGGAVTLPSRLDADERDTAHHTGTLARGTHDGLIHSDELLELDAALTTAVLVDRHAVSSRPSSRRSAATDRPAGRSSSRTPRRSLRGSRRSRRAGCPNLP